MKIVLAALFVLCSIGLATAVFAAPFLVCDVPSADQQVTGVKGTVDGTDFTTPYALHNGAVIVYDVGTLSPAAHSFTNIRFVNARGDGPVVPFALPALPESPSSIRMAP